MAGRLLDGKRLTPSPAPDLRYIAGMSIPDVVTAVLFANGLTLGFLYGCWRLNRNDRDLKAVGIILVCLLFAGIMAIGADQPEAPQAALYSSPAQAAGQR